MPLPELDDHWFYQCDGIVVDPCAHRLERDGQAMPVEPKAYAVLVALLEQAGNVVDKDTLLDAAWGHRHVTPGVLSHAISQLRHALGDSALHPRYIATVHTMGYRFMGEVHRRPRPTQVLTEPAADGASADIEVAPTSGSSSRQATR
ncbi:MAG: winged helix-turn-helix domain-containing protein [Rhodanobacter sp.]